MDLHAWITQQVDQIEEAARSALEGRRVVLQPHDGGPVIKGTVTEVKRATGDLNFTIARYGVEPRDERPAPAQLAAAVLRRCEADRRILARHRLDPDVTYEPACKGCGTYGDLDLSNVDNLNDCPELLDLAHAHGITPEILASLDRPTTPEQKLRPGPRLGLADILAPRTPMGEVPSWLRGPNWKPGAT
ncbi:DUF6221 family protein [Streptomyces pseudogriseolus]|uniref:DUF6221 family protein n=1 Tax=Streptomyces pseudogriseolus TaxID=36817 RepID=UPI0036537C1A